MRAALTLTLLTGLLSACSTPKGNRPFLPPGPYVRMFQADSNHVALQIAAKKFVPVTGKGPAIWMTGVCHIGESNYFVRLQQHLDTKTLVLFEGIGDASTHNPPPPRPNAVGTNSTSDETLPKPKLSTLQFSIADSLGLTFQLEAIDYDRPNFRNSDLSVEQLQELMTESGGAGSFNRLLQTMEGGSWLDAIMQISLRFLGTNPKLQALSKLMLIEVLGQMEGDLEQLSLPPEVKRLLDVLIARRNQKVLSDLKLELRHIRRRDSLAVFYGTGHMPDLEERLRRDFQYQPTEQIWFTAFSVNFAQTPISPSERQFIHTLVKRQLEQLQPRDN
jgi:hypothetical protein